MIQIADLHIHSKYSRACSPALTLPNIDAHCRIKGVDIVATGDFTHPAWIAHIKEHLEPHHPGFFKLKGSDGKVSFVLATEVSCIYKRGGKVRRIHLCIMTPTIESVEELIRRLEADGRNLKADGRPILGIDVEDLTKMCFDIEPRMFIFPAHIWTPWFAMFGSKSGFDTVEECFGEMTPYIHAIETGLSSDPEMNWRLSALDKYTFISNSDSHSLPNIAREANIFDLAEISYDAMCDAIKGHDQHKLLKTIEFYPEEGMYHYDGHRDCEVRLTPEETKKQKGICPKCKKPLTVGVMYRVDELADRPEGFVPEKYIPFVKLVELDKIIAESLGIKSRKSKKVQAEFDNLIDNAGPELDILMNKPIEELKKYTLPIVAEGIRRVRDGQLIVEGGYDGQYGIVKIFTEDEVKGAAQGSLF